MLHSARELSELIGAIYAAGLDPSGARWPAVLARLSPVIAGGGSLLVGMQRRRFTYAHVHYVGSDPDSIALYQSYYGRLDPIFEPRLPTAPAGRLLLSDAIMPVRELRRTEFDADWLRPRAYGAGAAAVLTRHGSAEAGFYAVRPRGRGPFPAEDLEALGLLLPHLAGAVQASLRLAALGDARDAAVDALHHWGDAVLLVDGALRVHATNRAADALLARGDGLGVEASGASARGRLRAATPSATAALRRLVAAASAVATRASGEGAACATASLALARPSGGAALAVLVAPLPPAGAARAAWIEPMGASRATVAVLVTDPAAGGDDASSRERLRATYGLTPAEAAVAVAIAEGEGLQAVAATHGVALATVRTQARQTYRKTGVRGQAALARLVARLARAR